jgi:hypothetical protein
LRDLGIAQLGSLGSINSKEFSRRLAEKTIRVLIPVLFRDLFPNNKELLAVADRCEKEGTKNAAYVAAYAAYAADAANAAYVAVEAAYAAAYVANAADAAYAAANAANAADAAANAADADKYLNLSAKLALEVLREMQSPGVALL